MSSAEITAPSVSKPLDGKIEPTPQLGFMRVMAHAQMPIRLGIESFIYALQIIERRDKTEDSVGRVTWFKTGLKLNIPKGHYVSIYGSDDVVDRGYSLPQPLFFMGEDVEIEIPLLKFEEQDDIELPHPAVYMMMNKGEKFFATIEGGISLPTPKTTKSAGLRPSGGGEAAGRKTFGGSGFG